MSRGNKLKIMRGCRKLDLRKIAAAEHALKFIEPGMVIGLGTGTTAAYFIEALGRMGSDVRCVATSAAAAGKALSSGLKLVTLAEVREVDITVDGADQINVDLDAIKGRGGAFSSERIVWQASKAVIVIVDDGKLCQQLGGLPIPLEVSPFESEGVIEVLRRRLMERDNIFSITRSRGSYSPEITPASNPIYDLTFPAIQEPRAIEQILEGTYGVLGHGLFCGGIEMALVASTSGVSIYKSNPGTPPEEMYIHEEA